MNIAPTKGPHSGNISNVNLVEKHQYIMFYIPISLTTHIVKSHGKKCSKSKDNLQLCLLSFFTKNSR